ncbi:MAG: hypothetical protein K0R41_2326 [Geminicoccaceae bacterium]|nr:hypothetical protein [Geminicoccaceae bacterium]
MLADPDAIRGAFGTTRPANELGLPLNAHDVENVADPKGLMARAYDPTRGLRRGRRAARNYQTFLTLLGERVDLGRLDEVPAFQHFQQDLANALRLIMPHAFRP